MRKKSSFVFSTVRNDFSWHVGINVLFDFLKPFVLFVDEVFFRQVDQIYNGFSCDESVSVQDFDFRRFPVTLSYPNILVKKFFNSFKNIDLLSGFFIIGSFNLFVKIIDSVVNIFKIFKNKFGVNDLHVSDWVN